VISVEKKKIYGKREKKREGLKEQRNMERR
jgi:hypothetical protein